MDDQGYSAANLRGPGAPLRGLLCAPRDLYQAALLCGLAPLLIGTTIFLVWLVTRWPVFEAAGFITILCGVPSVIVGFVLLAASVFTQSSSPGARQGSANRRRALIRYVAAIAILLINFPAAAFIVSTVSEIMTRYVLTVANDGPRPLEDTIVSGGGITARFGTIGRGAEVTRVFNIQRDGELILRTKRGDNDIELTIDGYVTNGIGGNMVVVAKSDGTFDVNENPKKHHARLD